MSQVFVSYRREDSAANARSIRDRLASEFGDRNVFMDVDDLVAGQRFDEVLQKSLDHCDAVLVVIGPRWLQTLREKDRAGATDYVRIEIATALSRGILVIPVLVEHASLPAPADLPEEIRSLVLHHKIDVSHETFGADIRRLIDAIIRHRGVRRSLVSRRAMWPAAAVLASGAAALGLWWLPLGRVREQPAAGSLGESAQVQVTQVANVQGATRYDIRESLGSPQPRTRRFVRIVSLLSAPTPLDAAQIPPLNSFELLADPEGRGDITGEGTSTIYETLYALARAQKLSRENFRVLLTPLASRVNLRSRIVGTGDKVDLLFETEPHSGVPIDLIYAALARAGETIAFFRFLSSDGAMDFYDADGKTVRPLIIRHPVLGDEARLLSGFGYGTHQHPLLSGVERLHTGIDWLAPEGTPVVAAGGGTVEEAGVNGGYGNYVRIRHANGYQTAYGHLLKIEPDIVARATVRQGQRIGQVGSSGLSTGPHLHFEVLLDNDFVDPLRIEIPSARELSRSELAQFHKERDRIERILQAQPRSASR